MQYIIKPQNVCSSLMIVDIDANKTVTGLQIAGGCPGNTEAICRLCKGRKAKELITILKGIPCGPKKTSCPNELAKGLEKILKEIK